MKILCRRARVPDYFRCAKVEEVARNVAGEVRVLSMLLLRGVERRGNLDEIAATFGLAMTILLQKLHSMSFRDGVIVWSAACGASRARYCLCEESNLWRLACSMLLLRGVERRGNLDKIAATFGLAMTLLRQIIQSKSVRNGASAINSECVRAL